MIIYRSLGILILLAAVCVSNIFPLKQHADFAQFTNPVLETPYSAKTGDFNEDGHVDVAISNEFRGESYVTIMLGNGHGSFPLQTHFPVTGSMILDIAVDDFNGDDHQDICAVTMVSSSVSVLLGNGQGHFEESGVYETEMYPEYVTTGDFNEDNYPDIALNHWAAGEVSVMLNDGQGAFYSYGDYDLYGGTKEIEVGDFNEDDHLDLAVATMAYNVVVILCGDGSGSFYEEDSIWVDYDAYVVKVDDFNDDQHDDIAVGTKHSFLVLLGDGSVNFTRSFETEIFDPHAISTWDFNEDGNLDAVVSMSRSNQFQVFLGNGNGGFSDHTIRRALLSSPRSLDAADFNEDGHCDLVSANRGSDELSVLLNQVQLLQVYVNKTRSLYQPGDEASFVVGISNPQDSIVHGSLWLTLKGKGREDIIDPELIGGIRNPVEFEIPAGYAKERTVTFTIPESFEVGIYRFYVNVGLYNFLPSEYTPADNGQGTYCPVRRNSIVWSSDNDMIFMITGGSDGNLHDETQQP